MQKLIGKFISSAILMASLGCVTQAYAASYLYCTDKEGSYSSGVDTFTTKEPAVDKAGKPILDEKGKPMLVDKKIPPEYQDSVHFVGTSGNQGYIWLWGNVDTLENSHPALNVTSQIIISSGDAARNFCNYLLSFCPSNRPYLEVSGGNLSRNWWSHISMYHLPNSDANAELYICPNFQLPNGKYSGGIEF